MPPEQCHNRFQLDRRVDVYALGVVLYELITGVKPFQSTNDIELIQEILYKEDITPPAKLARDIPPELSAIALKALRKDPDERYPSCEALRDALAELSARHGWAVNERAIAQFMELRYQAHRVAFEQRLVGLLSSAAEPTKTAFTVDFEQTNTQRIALGPDCLGVIRQRGQLVGYKLSGQLRETLRYDALLDLKPEQQLVIDLANITRITSFGIRQWLQLLPALIARTSQPPS